MATRGQGGDSRKTRKKDMLHEAEAKLSALSLKPERPVMVENAAAGTLGASIRVQTNVFPVELQRPLAIWRYDIAIFAEIKGRKSVFFTKRGRDDCVVMSRKSKCKLVYDAILRTHPEFFGDPNMLWYDGQSVLFSGTDLFKVREKSARKFQISGKDCSDDSLFLFEIIIFEITTVDENHCISLTEKSMIDSMCQLDLSQNDRSIVQFMEVVFNQQAIMNPKEHSMFESGKTYLNHPWLYGFNERECPVIGDGKRLYPGTQKSIHFIEGQGGRGSSSPALVIDAKKAAFHEHMPLIEKAKIIINDDFSKNISEMALEKLNAGLKGLFFYTRHTGDERDHQIAAVVSHTASDITFELKDGVRVSILEYFADKYKINLEYRNAPLVKVREGGRVHHYPMELGWIKPMQRVTVPQQTPQQNCRTTRSCAIPPGERQDDIVKGASALKLFGSEGNAFVENAGLSIHKDPMEVPGRILPPPKIRYREGVATVTGGKWRTCNGQFFIPARCEIWALYAIVLKHDIGRFNERLLRDFGKAFFDEASYRGIKLSDPAEIIVTWEEEELESCLKRAASHNCNFCIIVSSDNITSHKKLKLWERDFEIITQEVKLSTAVKVVKERRVVTLENIVLKANVKLGGLNYDVDLGGMPASEDVKSWFRQRLFLGISVNHAPHSNSCDSDKGTPAVVGYAANFKTNSLEFVGDYLFQNCGREETVTTMSEIVSIIIPKFAENHGGKFPRDLIIYRGGLPEGSFSTVLSHEIPLLRATLSTLGAENIRITFIVVQKKHNMRLMLPHIDRSSKQSDQNIPPGVVVDSDLTHPTFKEFYLNSHLTLQGSSCTPRYTTLVDDVNMTMNELECMTYVLTYAHQIVNAPTSLPTPLYVANRYAERGRNNYEAYLISCASTSSESGASIDYGRLAHRLSYNDTKLANIRINA